MQQSRIFDFEDVLPTKKILKQIKKRKMRRNIDDSDKMKIYYFEGGPLHHCFIIGYIYNETYMKNIKNKRDNQTYTHVYIKRWNNKKKRVELIYKENRIAVKQ